MELESEAMAPSFPQEIIQEILFRLPTKSLLKSTLVCKTWRSMIKSQSFIRAHLSTTFSIADQYDRHSLLLHYASGVESNVFLHKILVYKLVDEVYSLHYDNQDFGEYSKIEFPVSLKVKLHNPFYRVVGICDGLVCLADDMYRYGYNFLIWNPEIKKLVTLPTPGVTFRTHAGYDASIGFGVDARTNDYKVVRIVTLLDQRGSPTVAEVYSLATGSWSSLGCVSPACLIDGAASNAFVNGVLHWPVVGKTNDGLCYFILTFGLGSELFGKMFMPKRFKWDFEMGILLSVSGDGKSIALFTMDGRCEDSFLDIWEMREYGIKGSWTKLITLGPQGPERLLPRALGFRKSGEVLLMLTEKPTHELASLDLASKQIKRLGISGYQYCSADFYKKSLLLLDKADADSY